MNNLTREERELLITTQKNCREIKEVLNRRIMCPFQYSYKKINSMEKMKSICTLCHKWMGTDFNKSAHPCLELNEKEVKKRFWRSTDEPTN